MLAHTQLETLLLQAGHQRRQLLLEGLAAELVEHVAQELDVHGPHGMDARGAQVELALFLLDAVAHGQDDGRIFAAQAAQFQHLLVQIPPTDVEHPRRFSAQAGNTCTDGRTQNGLALAHDAAPERLFQNRQAAGLQHDVVALNLGHKPLLGRDGQHLIQPHAQHFGGGLALALQLVLDLLGRVERVPEGVDLVEHHQARVGPLRCGCQMLAPDAQVRAGHARVRTQNQIALIRETGSGFEESVYPSLLDQLAASQKGNGEAEAGPPSPPKQTVSVKSISAAGVSGVLETEADIDRYLDALRSALV